MQRRVLVVDDEPDILDLLVEELDLEGYNVVGAGSGNQALEKLNESEVDVIVSDYKMADGDGKMLLEYVNKTFTDRKPIFYFISGQADMSREEALQEGVQHFFYKPFDIDDLLDTLKRDLN